MSGSRVPGPDDELSPSDYPVLVQRQAEVLELVAADAPLSETLTAIIGALEELIPGARCSVLLVDAEASVLRHGAAPSLPTSYLAAIDGLPPGPRAGSCGTAAHLGIPIIAVDVRTDERWVDYRHAAEQAGLRSCWSSPIADPAGTTVGTFAVYHDTPHHPDARESCLVDRFTYLASVAIEHRRLLGDLIESEELFRRTFDENPAGQALLDLDGTIERVNAAFVAVSGYEPTELMGSALDSVIPGGLVSADGTERERRSASRVARQHTHTRQQLQLHRRDGASRPVETSISVVRSRDGQPAKLVLNLVDLTERLAAESERAARLEAEIARQTAEDHATAKSDLLASVSHEVRTPLQAITGFTELLTTLDLDAERRGEALSRINVAADHLLRVVTDVLDISRAEAGVLPLSVQSVDIAESLDEILPMLAAAAADRGVTCVSAVPSGAVVLADRGRLNQVLLNIIGNAIRYGRREGVVEVRTATTAESVIIEIVDDGSGIPTDYLPRLFTPFARARDTEDAGAPVGGYGLGLMLTHGLVRAMGGTVTGANADTGGAVFTVVLPVGSTRPAARSQTAHTTARRPDRRPMRG
ncbi:putative two-component histidine kinase [Gordonia polyisoprenivorans NBRC 16320 = JCM 10675]|uniref:histidine kinase n=1 Tax=Gordonia polyisoprenivorans TaxID=84595 RepID=A0A846WJX6_9ACTN|nr:ATP-binding protein [Gordonia polyisoprenivorans]NKY01397.1 PAS domain S-box protein [Gordonia polyisoprenivorans]GAB26276.1 putative two-component histidine kinase [Gordonia polyisoprenivorans NBRC 16320 = JCM 10675]